MEFLFYEKKSISLHHIDDVALYVVASYFLAATFVSFRELSRLKFSLVARSNLLLFPVDVDLVLINGCGNKSITLITIKINGDFLQEKSCFALKKRRICAFPFLSLKSLTYR